MTSIQTIRRHFWRARFKTPDHATRK